MSLLRGLLLPVVVAFVMLGAYALAPAGREVEIVIRYSRFGPAAVSVPAGVPIMFVLRNQDPIDHEWIVGDEASHERHRTGTEPAHGARPTEQSIAALDAIRTTVTFPSPGTYRMICHLPGHEAYGMVGTITVTR
jgi:uncharacterized cupredoxin-like copper-binding protein